MGPVFNNLDVGIRAVATAGHVAPHTGEGPLRLDAQTRVALELGLLYPPHVVVPETHQYWRTADRGEFEPIVAESAEEVAAVPTGVGLYCAVLVANHALNVAQDAGLLERTVAQTSERLHWDFVV